jgi:hypothetical protein
MAAVGGEVLAVLAVALPQAWPPAGRAVGNNLIFCLWRQHARGDIREAAANQASRRSGRSC